MISPVVGLVTFTANEGLLLNSTGFKDRISPPVGVASLGLFGSCGFVNSPTFPLNCGKYNDSKLHITH